MVSGAQNLDPAERMMLELEAFNRKQAERQRQKELNDKLIAESKAKSDETFKNYEEFKDQFRDVNDAVVDQIGVKQLPKFLNQTAHSRDGQPTTKHQPITIKSGKEAAGYLKDSKRILILTGAGISAASGVPNFTGDNGFWKRDHAGVDDPVEIMTCAYFEKHPQEFWEFHQKFNDIMQGKSHNAGHVAIQEYIDWSEANDEPALLVT